MIIKYDAILFSFVLFFSLLGCSVSQEVSAYTAEEIDFYQQAINLVNDIHAHFRNFDTIGKNAKPPYNDPDLLSNLQDELDQTVQEAQAITDLNCPSSRFKPLCDDFVRWRDTIIVIRDDNVRYYASGLDASYRQQITNDGIVMTAASQNIADDVAKLEEQFGEIK